MSTHAKVDATSVTPLFELNFETGIIRLEGKSISGDAIRFYQPIQELMNEYVQHPAPQTTITIQLDYFSTSSAKCLLDFFQKAETLGDKATIIWQYDKGDYDIQEAGEQFRDLIKLKFKFVELK